MMEPYEQRRARLTRATRPGRGFLWGNEYLAQKHPKSSEQMLNELAADSWAPGLFLSAARALMTEDGLSGRVYKTGDRLPPLQSDSHFVYGSQYSEAANRLNTGPVIVSTVTEADRVIGFGIAVGRKSQSKIEIINFERFSGRSAGVARTVSASGKEFTVGIGHVLIDLLLTELPRPGHADAKVESFCYICRSLGFVPRRTRNPRLLVLK